MTKDSAKGDDRDSARRKAESAEVLRDLATVDAQATGTRRRSLQEAAVAKELQLESEYLERMSRSENAKKG